MIIGNHPLQFTVAGSKKPYAPSLWAQSLKSGGADVAISIGNAYVHYRLERAEVLALAQWLTAAAGED
jgi:hypothetical protein